MATTNAGWVKCEGPGRLGKGCSKPAKRSKQSLCKACRTALAQRIEKE